MTIEWKLRFADKLWQCADFVRHSRTPFPLILDSFKLKRRPFVAVSEEGLKLELAPSDGESFTFFENLIRRDYLQHGIRLGPGDTVIDVGANIGSFTVLAAHQVGPKGRVFAFEPASAAFTRLRANVQLNEFENVTTVNAAMGGVNGEAQLYHADRSAYSSLSEQIDGRESVAAETVRVQTLGSVMEVFGLDRLSLLKLDCEGAEYDILNGLDLETAQKVMQIAIEVHRIPGHDTEEIPRILKRLGYTTRETHPLVAFRA